MRVGRRRSLTGDLGVNARQKKEAEASKIIQGTGRRIMLSIRIIRMLIMIGLFEEECRIDKNPEMNALKMLPENNE